MARLSDLDIIRCTECGKLIQKEEGRSLCDECASGLSRKPPRPTARESQFIHAFAQRPGLPQAGVERSGRDELAKATHKDKEKCVRCKTKPAVEESDLCIYCILDLYRSLGDASNELFGQMEVLEEEPASGRTVVSLLRDKERLTGSSHFDFASGPHLRS
jgi:hypothetical protein